MQSQLVEKNVPTSSIIIHGLRAKVYLTVENAVPKKKGLQLVLAIH